MSSLVITIPAGGGGGFGGSGTSVRISSMEIPASPAPPTSARSASTENTAPTATAKIGATVDARTAFTYLYLVIYAVAFLLIAVSHYNLSAKRFRARGKPAGLAGILPLAALLTGAAHWIAPRVGDGLPGWTVPAVDFAMLVIVIWTMLELGLKRGAGD